MADALSCETLVLIVCESGVAEKVVEHLTGEGITHYTLLQGALGIGETGRHQGTSIWPGENTVIFSCFPENRVEGVLSALKLIHDSRTEHTLGIKVFALPVRELL